MGREIYTGRPCARTASCQQIESRDKAGATHGNNTIGQHTVDLDVSVLFSGEVGLREGELFGGFLIRVEPAYVANMTSEDTAQVQVDVKSTNLPSPRVWCSMGLVLSCKVFGVPTMWTTGTCSENAGRADDGFGN